MGCFVCNVLFPMVFIARIFSIQWRSTEHLGHLHGRSGLWGFELFWVNRTSNTADRFAGDRRNSVHQFLCSDSLRSVTFSLVDWTISRSKRWLVNASK